MEQTKSQQTLTTSSDPQKPFYIYISQLKFKGQLYLEQVLDPLHEASPQICKIIAKKKFTLYTLPKAPLLTCSKIA